MTEVSTEMVGYPSEETALERARTKDSTQSSSNSMKRRKESLSQSIIERAALVASVKWLGSHVPVCVLNRLWEEARLKASNKKGRKTQQFVKSKKSDTNVNGKSNDFSNEVLTEDLLSQIQKDNKHSNEAIILTPLPEISLGQFYEEEGTNEEGSLNFKHSEVSSTKPQKRRSMNDGYLGCREIDLTQQQSKRRENSEHRTKYTNEEIIASRTCRKGSYHSLGDMSDLSFDFNNEEELDGCSECSQENDYVTPLKEISTDSQLPYASTHLSALLFVDISGFTKLSMMLGPEQLSKCINSYFELIVNIVTSHGGDILKFAGDGLFAEWQATSDCNHQSHLPRTPQSRHNSSLKECVAAAATCGANIIYKCSDYPVFENGDSGAKGAGEHISTLDVHCGLGSGRVVGVHVGNTKRREYLILGTPIEQVVLAAQYASLGELYASPEALEVMSRKYELLDGCLTINSCGKPVLIARKNLSGFTSKSNTEERRCSVAYLWEEWDTEVLEEYRQLIFSYTHPVVVDNEIGSSNRLRILDSSTAQQRQVEEAELRSVYVMFINMPNIDCVVGLGQEEDRALFHLLNGILNLTTTELNRFSGHLRQFIVDDKGLVLIATFGLRGSTFPNMVTERALPATLVIHNELQNKLGIHNRIGVTVGSAYCGVVGGLKRHEYAVLGPSVNLAARLMSMPENPGILVSEAVRMKAGKVFAFKALAPVKAKGYSTPVAIFEPLSPIERRWGTISSEFVGRRSEITSILTVAKEAIKFHSDARLLFVTGDSGSGKSTLVVHAMDQIRKLINKGRKRHRVTKHICRESDVLVPFRSVLPDILQDIELQAEEGTPISTSRHSQSGIETLDWDCFSRYSAHSKVSTFSKESSCCSADKMVRLKNVLGELDAPDEFINLIGYHLLGWESETINIECDEDQRKNHNIASSINFMVKVFQRCTRHAHFIVLALDDVHLMDEVSWHVVLRLFHTVRNLLIICTSRTLTSYKLALEADDWTDLNTKYKENGRFVHIELNRLKKDDVRSMIAKRLALDENEIDDSFHNDVYTQSRGMPAFANEILRSACRRNNIERQGNNKVGWKGADRGKGELTPASVGGIIVHRLDTFTRTVRTILDLGAVLGTSFDLADIINVTNRTADCPFEDKEENSQKIHDALDFLVNEGILVEVCLGGDVEGEHYIENDLRAEPSPSSLKKDHVFQDKTYTFCHDIWRASILSLMLESRKKRIHKFIASSLQAQTKKCNTDYMSLMKIWNHLTAAGERTQAADVALAVGKSFEGLGMYEQSVKLYEDTLGLWRAGPESVDSDAIEIGGFRSSVLAGMNRIELEYTIRIFVSIGKALANLHRGSDSVVAYQNALQIMQVAPSARLIRDRSILFPIFSGLFLALKYGQIEQDDDCLYEQDLVRRFVTEAKLYGDPVHYARALSMQAEMFGRLEKFPQAFAAFEELASVYDAEKHSDAISKAYGSDRAAQCFAISALWYIQLDDMEAAVEMCEFIFEHLMPKMNLRNVHNSALLIYPTIWVMKSQNRCLEMLELFVKYVVEPFDEFLGEGAFTFCLPIYDPIMMLLDLCENKSNTLENLDDYVDWAIDSENLRFGQVINNGLGNFGRDCNSVSSEICLLLANRSDMLGHERQTERRKLILSGLDLARESLDFTKQKKMIPALLQTKPVLQALEVLAIELGIVEENRNSSCSDISEN